MTKQKVDTGTDPEVKTTQADPTKPQRQDRAGRMLDEFGLPLSGPARVRALQELGKPDPREDPEAWGVKPPAADTSGE